MKFPFLKTPEDDIKKTRQEWLNKLSRFYRKNYNLAMHPLQTNISVVPPKNIISLVQKKDKSNPDVFFEAGYRQTYWYLNELKSHGFRPDRMENILDFGVGTGQLLLHYLPFSALKYGCDITPQAAEWTKNTLGNHANIRLTGSQPPLPYGDLFFDYIYANSVFTHIPYAWQEKWAAELYRILKPGGCLIVTAHDPLKFDQKHIQTGWYEKNPDGGVQMNIYFTEDKLKELWGRHYKILKMLSYSPKQLHMIMTKT